jgi:hypothetical protein
MKKFTILFLLIILSITNVKAQQVTTSATGVELLLYSDYKNEVFTRSFPLKITNTQNVIISGDFSSDYVVNIIPNNGKSIIIKPLVAVSSPTARITAEGTTVVKKSSTNTANPGTSKRFKIYPDPVDTVLNFDSPYEYVISYQVNDLNGMQKMILNITPTTSGTIDVSNLTSGNYILTLILQHSYIKIQFIKN